MPVKDGKFFASARWGFALWALLAPAALGAPIDIAPVERAPLQLSLPFAAAPTAALAPSLSLAATLSAPALTTALAAPAAIGAAPALAAAPFAAPIAVAASPSAAPRAADAAAHWSEMPPAVARAFRSGDARGFWEACRAADFSPPETDDAQQSLLHEGAALLEADRLALALFAPSEASATRAAAPTRATKIDYAAFGTALARRPGLSGDIFRDVAAKRAILKAAGYTRLHASGGQRVAIEDASDARIGRTFAATLRAYRNQLAR